MKEDITTDDLFANAIAAEYAAKHFYEGLSHIFSHIPEVSLIWREMMDDEDIHAHELQDIRNTLTPELLGKPAERSLAVKVIAEVEKLDGKFDIKKVRTIDDAMDLAYELEYSEVNTLFRTMVKEFVSSQTRSKFVSSLIEEHVARLEELLKVIPAEEDRGKLSAVHKGLQGDYSPGA